MAKRSPMTKRQSKRQQFWRRLWQLLLVGFLLLNAVTYAGAYSLTHFRSPGEFRLGRLRPNSPQLPSDNGLTYVTQRLTVNEQEWLETWLIPATNPNPKGTILLFHGNGGSKSSQLLAPANIFHQLGYNTLLVDFRGVGGSSGNTTTFGAKEAQDVAVALDYVQAKKMQSPVILYGISMGSAAIMKAIAPASIQPDALILELPFAVLMNAVESRLAAVNLPTFPLAGMLVFWGSIQHGFDGFEHNPASDARLIICPTLVLHGALDPWTTDAEIQQIFNNLSGEKTLTIFPEAGHQLLVTVDAERWQKDIKQFLDQLPR